MNNQNTLIIPEGKKLKKLSRKAENIKMAIEYDFNKYAKERRYREQKKTIALIGLGPHAKRIYLSYFKKHKVDLGLVVELKSKKEYVKKYLSENGFKDTKIFAISDDYKDFSHLPSNLSSDLLAVCNTLEITHIIIATEPKAHNMYIEFALRNNVHVMTDKPITVSKNMTSVRSINKVRNQYYDLLKLEEKSDAMCKVMCQRQYHKGYEYIKTLLNEIVSKYKVPITYIDIYHCDGNWEMSHDLLKENHPYKYGYGKLKRIVGIPKILFELIMEVIEHALIEKHKKGGRNPILNAGEILLMTMTYYRDYPTFLSLGNQFGIDESNAFR